MDAVLYGMRISNASLTALGAMRVKRLRFRFRDLVPGFHPGFVRMFGFSGWTVPALRIDGRRIQGSLDIVRELEALFPELPLFPADPKRRLAVEEAEAWGEGELQDIPRRIFRWATVHDLAMRRWLVGDVAGLPVPAVMCRVGAPLSQLLARNSGASDAVVRADVEGLRATLDHVDGLIAAGTIGGETPNAADLQIFPSVRSLLAFADLREMVAARPCGAAALRVFPDYPDVPPTLPADWLHAT
jgi:glutathione S-transferase